MFLGSDIFLKDTVAVASNLFFRSQSIFQQPSSLTGIHSTRLVFFFWLGKAFFLWKNTSLVFQDEAAFIGLREQFDLLENVFRATLEAPGDISAFN